MNIPWIEVIKSNDLYTLDNKLVYIRRGTLSGTIYKYLDDKGNEIKDDNIQYRER